MRFYFSLKWRTVRFSAVFPGNGYILKSCATRLVQRHLRSSDRARYTGPQRTFTRRCTRAVRSASLVTVRWRLIDFVLDVPRVRSIGARNDIYPTVCVCAHSCARITPANRTGKPWRAGGVCGLNETGNNFKLNLNSADAPGGCLHVSLTYTRFRAVFRTTEKAVGRTRHVELS